MPYLMLQAYVRVLFLWISFCLLTSPVLGKKNVLVILADDGGFEQSAYNNSVCDTPNLDKLASRSVILNRGYTSVSSCSPSRSVLLTGLPQHQNGQYGLGGGGGSFLFRSFDEVKSLPVILSGNGVRTGLIGKKHVGPPTVYKFDYERSPNNGYDHNQIGRNITFMNGFVKEFLNANDDRPFFLYIAFHDPHREDPVNIPTYGPFRNKWGTGMPGMGVIPDWKPKEYDPNDVIVPFFLPDTPMTREDISAMYTVFNRMDQGIGLFLEELKASGHMDDTLILFTSDNGIPFPNAKTNLYEPGMGEPIMISSPDHKEHWGKYSNALTSIMDFAPTILDWFGIDYPHYNLNGQSAFLTGNSLLSLAANPEAQNYTEVYSSHDLHEITMNYPMRVLRTDKYRLIHNLNNRVPYPMALDVYTSPTYLDMMNRTASGQPTHWFKTLQQYYYRDEWELFDLENDPQELKNLASDPEHLQTLKAMQETLDKWVWSTNDPWRCMPHGVFYNDICGPLYNEFTEE